MYILNKKYLTIWLGKSSEGLRTFLLHGAEIERLRFGNTGLNIAVLGVKMYALSCNFDSIPKYFISCDSETQRGPMPPHS